MPEACGDCGGRPPGCPKCTPAPVLPPEPVEPKSHCPDCRTKDEHIGSLLRLAERMLGPAPVVEMTDPEALPPGTQVVDLRTEAQRNPDLANTIALIEVAVDRFRDATGVSPRAESIGNLIQAVASLRHDFEDGAALEREATEGDRCDTCHELLPFGRNYYDARAKKLMCTTCYDEATRPSRLAVERAEAEQSPSDGAERATTISGDGVVHD